MDFTESSLQIVFALPRHLRMYEYVEERNTGLAVHW